MAFNSLHFLLFFPVACLLFFLLPLRVRWVWLLVASYYFYMSWNASYALLILTSTVVTYCGGLLIHRFAAPWKRRTVLALSFLVNLAILVFFKYANFIIDNVNGLLGLVSPDRHYGHLDLLLPVGISFYTFQALSYTMDVYRGKIGAETNFFRYALFVSFFPQLVAGPIERSANLLPQIWIEHKFDWARVRNGLYLMAWGFFLKMVIADRLAIAVDAIFGNYTSYPGLMIILGTIMFGMQIYCDFNGYSQIAIGAAEVLGFSLMSNFAQPYFARSVQEFWRRWHVSLSTWFRDYLYIPLGGSRCGKVRSCLNIAVTFLASGLWHGASWNFVAWGGLHGAYLVVEKLEKDLFERRAKRTGTPAGNPGWGLRELVKVAITFFLVQFAWLFFRSSSCSQAFGILRRIGSSDIGFFTTRDCGLGTPQIVLLVLSVLLLFAVDAMHERGLRIRRWLGLDYPRRALGVLLFVAGFSAVFFFGVWGDVYHPASFIYFQF